MKKVWMLLLMLSAAVALADTRHSAIGQTPQMSPSDLFLIMTNGAGGPRTKQITASNALESLKSFSNWTGGSGGGGTLTNFAAGSNAVLYVDQGTNIFAAKTDTNAVQFVATNAGALLWYPLANPAGYINGSALNAYALIASLGTSAYSNANSFVLSSSGVATNLLVYSIPGGTISFKRNSSGNTVLFSIDNDTGNVRGKGNLYGFNGSDGSFFFAGSTITGDATQLVAPLFTGNGFGLTNLNSAIATNAAGAPDGYVFVKSGDKIKLIQITGGGDLLAANNLSDLASPAQGLINLGGVPSARAVNTSSPLLGGGSLNGNLSLSIQNAQADGSTKGAATFAAADFDSTVGGLISIDYANGQKATTSLPGFLTSADWNTFNNKAAAGWL
jgi:hypothetical protein